MSSILYKVQSVFKYFTSTSTFFQSICEMVHIDLEMKFDLIFTAVLLTA